MSSAQAQLMSRWYARAVRARRQIRGLGSLFELGRRAPVLLMAVGWAVAPGSACETAGRSDGASQVPDASQLMRAGNPQPASRMDASGSKRPDGGAPLATGAEMRGTSMRQGQLPETGRSATVRAPDASAPMDDEDAGVQRAPAIDRSDSEGSDADAGVADAGPFDRPAALADQAQPSMVNGIAIDERGYLWVAAGAESQLLRLEPPGEKIVERHGTQTALDGPDDLVVTRDAVYYTAMAAGNVNRLDRRTGENSVLASVGLGVNPIVLTAAGTLLVGLAPGPVPALAPLFTGLFEVETTAARPARTVLRDSRSINAFCVAPDGYVYGPTLTSVVRIELTSATFTTLHEGFGYAGAVRYNPRDGRLYVLDVAPMDNPRAAVLYSMELDGSEFSLFARMSAVSGDRFSADNFAIARDGTFYVTRLYEPKITRVSSDGSRQDDFVIGAAVAP